MPGLMIQEPGSHKGTVPRDFLSLVFFLQTVPPGPRRHAQKRFRFFSIIRRDIRFFRCFANRAKIWWHCPFKALQLSYMLENKYVSNWFLLLQAVQKVAAPYLERSVKCGPTFRGGTSCLFLYFYFTAV
jgi:hypothetical protein